MCYHVFSQQELWDKNIFVVLRHPIPNCSCHSPSCSIEFGTQAPPHCVLAAAAEANVEEISLIMEIQELIMEMRESSSDLKIVGLHSSTDGCLCSVQRCCGKEVKKGDIFIFVS